MPKIIPLYHQMTRCIEAQIKQYARFLAMGMVWLCLGLLALLLLCLMKSLTSTAVSALQTVKTHHRQALALPIVKDDHPLPPSQGAYWRVTTVQAGDTPITIFHHLSLSLHSLHDILALKQADPLRHLHPGASLRFLVTQDHHLKQLMMPMNLTDTLKVAQTDDGFSAQILHKHLEETLKYTVVDIQHSLATDAHKAGVPDKLVMALANIFEWNIDFSKDLRPGDHFDVLYKTYFLDGKKVRDGDIIEAEFTNRGTTYRALRYTDKSGQTHYYTPEGLSLQRPFLRTPVKYTRISSRFTLGRFHPILHRMRAHKGVDYASPTGTPIRSTSDGKIIFIGKRGGYGNVVIIQHNAKYSTLYGHMHGFAKHLHKFSPVHQGQVIGYVGQTGLATGPHLHYEFRINGIHRNPLTVKLPNPHPIALKYRAQFKAYAQQIMTQVGAYRQSVALSATDRPAKQQTVARLVK